MWKYPVQVDGMMCGMCESHVNDAVRKAFPVKKITSSRSKKETTVIAETELDEDALRAAISAPAMRWGRSGRSPGRRKGCLAGKESGHSVKERRLNFAGRISGGLGRLDPGDARRTGLPVLSGGGGFPLPLRLPPLHFETLFCLRGSVTLTRRDGSFLTAGARQVLMLTDLSNLTGGQCGCDSGRNSRGGRRPGRPREFGNHM